MSERSVETLQRQRPKGRKGSAGQRKQSKQLARSKPSSACKRAGKGRKDNGKQEVKPSGDLLQSLQKRHLEEKERAEIIRLQMKF